MSLDARVLSSFFETICPAHPISIEPNLIYRSKAAYRLNSISIGLHLDFADHACHSPKARGRRCVGEEYYWLPRTPPACDDSPHQPSFAPNLESCSSFFL